MPTPVGGTGHGVVGTNPETGEPTVVGVDENGDLVYTEIPAGIRITETPRKTEYQEGETIDYTGIRVYAIKANGSIFTDSSYHTGEIPFNELKFPEEKAYSGDVIFVGG